MLAHIGLYLFSFLCIWIGSGFIINAASKFAQKMRVSPFIFSFLFLGLLTSIPELSVGLQSIASGHSEIFIGNLLGGVMVLFTVVIPVLAVIGGGISVRHELKGIPLVMTLGVILAPSYFILDQRVTNTEGVIMIGMYVAHMLFIQKRSGILNQKNTQMTKLKSYSHKDFLMLLLGFGLIFISSHLLLKETLFFAEYFGISAFYISLIVVALGTDFPEFILAIRSVLSQKKDIAMGDYIGAASASTLLFGIFTLLNQGEILTINNFVYTFAFMTVALCLYFIFSQSKQAISRGEGIVLFGVYLAFLAVEILTKSPS